MGYVISTILLWVLFVNPMGRIQVRHKSFRNNLKILCHPISNRLKLHYARVGVFCKGTSIQGQWALRFLVVREIDCGNWLARRCMPAHQHCHLFYPLGWGSAWVYRKLGNALVLQSGTGSWVLSG